MAGLLTLKGTAVHAQQPLPSSTQPPARPAAQPEPGPTDFVVTGDLFDQDEQPLVGAIVTVDEALVSTSTDRKGHFVLRLDFSRGPVNLIFTQPGYVSQSLGLPRPSRRPLQVVMQQTAYDLGQTTRAVSRREENVFKVPAQLDHLTAAELPRDPALDYLGALGRRKGVDLIGHSLLLTQLSTRGFAASQTSRMVQLTDYADTQSPSLSYNLGNLTGASPLDIESVDLIHGPASALYGVNAFNGVVLVTTKDPFQTPGFTAEFKGGTSRLGDAQLRYARSWGRVAAKLTLGYTQAHDWLGRSEAAQSRTIDPFNHAADDVRGYNAVNRYGDEGYTFDRQGGALRGQRVYMPGWTEATVAADDNQAKNLRFNPTVAWLLNPRLKATYEYRFTRSTATLQTTDRYRLDNADYHLHRLELQAPRWSLRAYSARDNGGGTFGMSTLGSLLQNAPDPSTGGQQTYAQHYFSTYAQAYNAWLQAYPTDQNGAYAAARSAAAPVQLAAGTPKFDALRHELAYNATPGQGARLAASSTLYDVSGQYEWEAPWLNVQVGGAARSFQLSSGGTLFRDEPQQPVGNYQYGGYVEASRALWQRRLRLTAALRLDAFQNFQPVASPRVAGVLLVGGGRQHAFRASYGQAYTTPTQLQQYMQATAGPAVRLGNIGTGFQGFALDALATATTAGSSEVRLAPLQLEKVRTTEIGYRGLLNEQLLVGLAYFNSTYYRFIDSKTFIGRTDGSVTSYDELASYGQPNSPLRLIQSWYNEDEPVGLNGATADVQWFAGKAASFWANYTFTHLAPDGEEDIIKTLNTPKHKFNVGLNGQIGRLRYDAAYRWAAARYYATPFAEGALPDVTTVDVQLAYPWVKHNLTFKLGGTNLTNSPNVQIYGGPNLGRLLYAGLRFDLPQ